MDSFPGQKIRYVVYKRINEIEELSDAILKTIDPKKRIENASASLVFSYATVTGLKTTNYMPEMETEDDVIKSVEFIKKFLTETGFQMLAKYSDVKELDKTINGENFWSPTEDHPFNLGSSEFYVKRLAIAKLANANNFDRTVKLIYEHLDKLALDRKVAPIDRSDLNQRIPFAIDFLNKLEL